MVINIVCVLRIKQMQYANLWFLFTFGCYLSRDLVIKHASVSITFLLWNNEGPQAQLLYVMYAFL